MISENSIYQGDCIEVMREIGDRSIDMILCDLPYGTTRLKWDEVIPFAPLWAQYERIIKDNGAIVLTSSQPFTTDLINSNRRLFRYDIVWEKTQKSGFLNAKKQPLRAHENILIFYKKSPVFNAQKYTVQNVSKGKIRNPRCDRSNHYGKMLAGQYIDDGTRCPHSVIKFSNWTGVAFGRNINKVQHPTQKPVALFEWLIRSYSNENDVVLDNCIGSGTTAIACINTGRKYIGIEKDEAYFEVAKKRISEHEKCLFK